MKDKKQLFHLRFVRIAKAFVTFLVVLFLAEQIFHRSYVNRQHFRLRSFASLCERPLAGKKSIDSLLDLSFSLLLSNLRGKSLDLVKATSWSWTLGILETSRSRFSHVESPVTNLTKISLDFIVRDDSAVE